MSNSLTRDAGFKLGPIAFETFVKHYYEKLVKEVDEKRVPLRKEELLYDEVFHIVKSFLAQASRKHTVEELQGFSNTRTPNTPANHVVRVTVPLSCCDEAAESLIRTFGGEEAMKKTAGGVKWWQVRGIRGVNAEWMCAKKDMVGAQRQSRARSGPAPRKDPRARASKFGLFTTWDVPTRPDSLPEVQSKSSSEPADHSPGRGADGEDVYRPEMDGMKCILFFHGGGYYFGSVDQERYTIQRMARKIRGRVLAVNYRLAPQYPFPCAIQDILASYLFLIRPPSSAAHAPISPSDIVIAGDSAGGGLALALLQVLRDSELPLPAGGILISPWCDLTHSFPSIFQNTETDVIPATGLSIHKPSSLWPPPDEDTTAKMREGLRTTVSKAIRRHRWGGSTPDLDGRHVGSPLVDERPTNQSVVTLPPADVQADQTVMVETQQGSTVEIKSQLHLYVPNGLISHPLVSPALSYLGGLPPLLFIASDREVLRDEVIYAAHRAAHPEQFPIRDDTRAMYPPFKDLDTTSMKPTVVHLQVYDDAAHVLPVLFPFTQPAKYCFRAMATFCKQVFEVRPIPIITGSALRQSPKEEKELFIASDHAEMQGPTDGLKTAPSPDEESHRELHQANGESSTSSSLPNSKATQPMPLRQPEDEGHSTSNSTHRNPQDSLLLTTAPSTSGELSSSGLHPPIALEFSVDTPIKATSLNGALEHPSSSEDTQKTQSRSTRFSDTDLPLPPVTDPVKQDGSLSTSGSHPSKLKRRESESATTNLRSRSSFRAISGAIARYGTLKRHPKKESGNKVAPVERVGREGSEDVAGPRGKGSEPRAPSDVLAGDPIVYSGGWPSSSSKLMIRERVSTQGIIRPLEFQQDLSAFSVPETQVGAVPVPAIQRYLAAKENMDRKYARAIRRIARERAHAIAHADAGQVAHMHRLQHYLDRQREGDNNTGESVLGLGVLGANWNLAWALDAEERPPPSSIVARRDTKEAIALASVADQAIFVSESSLNANNLWSLMINFFTAPPREKEKETRQEYVVGEKEKQRKRRSSLGFWRVGHNARAQREGPENTQAGERKEATRQAQVDLSPSATS